MKTLSQPFSSSGADENQAQMALASRQAALQISSFSKNIFGEKFYFSPCVPNLSPLGLQQIGHPQTPVSELSIHLDTFGNVEALALKSSNHGDCSDIGVNQTYLKNGVLVHSGASVIDLEEVARALAED